MHNIDQSNGQDNIAFLGDRADIWHSLGQQMKPGMTIPQWAKAAGLEWSALLAPAMADIRGTQLHAALINKYLASDTPVAPELHNGYLIVPNQKQIIRSDTGTILGYATDSWKPVQPAETLDWFNQYISVDPRFKLDVAGSLRGGKVIWATAIFEDGILSVGGDKHRARLLMTTSFDQSAATINKGTMTRVVCNNTLDVALAGQGGVIKTRHNTNFNAERVGKELANIIKGFHGYKAMGDAMSERHFKKEEISIFFKKLLAIPFDAKPEDISTRKMNQFNDLDKSYRATVAEGTAPETAWAALNAVTRYVDHSRGTRDTGDGKEQSQFFSAQFGSGATMKAQAVKFLYDMTDGDLLKSIVAKTEADKDIKAILRRPLRVS